jgi:hypothetical protein
MAFKVDEDHLNRFSLFRLRGVGDGKGFQALFFLSVCMNLGGVRAEA